MAEKPTSEKSIPENAAAEKPDSIKVGGRRAAKSPAEATAKSPAETVTETAQGKQTTESDLPAAKPADEKSTQEAQLTARQRAASSTSGSSVPDYPTPARRPASKRPGSFNPLAWVVDGATGLLEEVRHNDLGLSEDFWKHFYAARRESLLTAQALVNSMLAITEKSVAQAKDREERRKRRGEIDVKP